MTKEEKEYAKDLTPKKKSMPAAGSSMLTQG